MASRRSEIVDLIVSAIDGVGKPTGLTVSRSRVAPFAKSELLPAGKVIVYRTQEVAERGDGRYGYQAKRNLVVRAECRVASATDGETIEDALDPLTSWVVQAVGAITWPRYVDRCQDVNTSWAMADEDAVYGAAAVDFQITYITAAGNPDA